MSQLTVSQAWGNKNSNGPYFTSAPLATSSANSVVWDLNTTVSGLRNERSLTVVGWGDVVHAWKEGLISKKEARKLLNQILGPKKSEKHEDYLK